MSYEALADELKLLAEAGDWQAVRSWFAYWDKEKIYQYYYEGKLVDDGVPEELVYKVVLWGRFFTPQYLRDATPDFHKGLISENFSEKNEFTAAPRGFANYVLSFK